MNGCGMKNTHQPVTAPPVYPPEDAEILHYFPMIIEYLNDKLPHLRAYEVLHTAGYAEKLICISKRSNLYGLYLNSKVLAYLQADVDAVGDQLKGTGGLNLLMAPPTYEAKNGRNVYKTTISATFDINDPESLDRLVLTCRVLWPDLGRRISISILCFCGGFLVPRIIVGIIKYFW